MTARKKTPESNSLHWYTVPLGEDWEIEIIEIPDETCNLLRLGCRSENKTFSGAMFPTHKLRDVIKALQAVDQARRRKATAP